MGRLGFLLKIAGVSLFLLQVYGQKERSDISSVNLQLLSGEYEWGSWGAFQYCPANSWVASLRKQVEGWSEDQTGLNGIELVCENAEGVQTAVISSSKGPFGKWSDEVYCPRGGFVRGARMQFYRKMNPLVDDAGATDIELFCDDKISIWPRLVMAGYDNRHWKEAQYCPVQMAICGVSTLVEAPQGPMDDTAMNGARFKCCTVPKQ